MPNTIIYHDLAAGNLTQDWSNAGLITANDQWPDGSIQGFLGQDVTTGTGTLLTTLTGNSAVANDLDVIANQSNTASTSGGVAEFDGITNPTIALQGSGTADVPHLVFYLNATGRQNVRVQFNARDIDGTTDNAAQQLNVQYRIGASGAWTNVAGGYFADVTSGPSLTTQVTAIDLTLPTAANGEAQVQVRVMTANAAGNDEWVGIDDIVISSSPAGDITAPTVASISPSIAEIADGTTTFTLAITFNEAMDVAFTPVISFPTSGENPAPAIGTSTGGAWSVNNTVYTATFAVTDANVDIANIDVEVSAAKDVAGNTMTAATTNNVFSVSQVNPTISSSTPADDATGVVPANDIVVNFSEAITIANASGIELRKSSDNSVVASAVSALGSALTINPTADLGTGESYYVSISANALTDASGNAFAGLLTPTVLNFTTSVVAVPTLSVSVSLSAQAEGASGATSYTYTFTWADIPSATSATYTVAANGPNGAAADDFVGGAFPTGTVAISAGSGSTTITVDVAGDQIIEQDEGFTLDITPISGVTINTSNAAAVITNDDTAASVSISGGSVTEGNSGTTTITFTVTRTGGNVPFTVDYATADGTATTADGDYASASGTLSFSGTDTSKTFTVTVNGDTALEANETFTASLSSATNSTTIGTSSATGTILADDFTKISAIQGAGHRSAMVGSSRTIEGIVTGTTSTGTARGYYVQEEDADADSDIGTSEGIFVFTGSTSPTVTVGQKVQVTGTIAEFVGSTAASLSLTQMTGATAVVVSSGNALPTAIIVGNAGRAPVSLFGDDAETGVFNPATEAADFWESLEGMRVTIDNPTAAGPFRNSFGEIMVLADGGVNDGSLTGRGGVTIRDTTPNTVLPGSKVFDFNGERIQIDDGLDGGSTSALTNTITVGDTYADITGIASYSFGFYEVNISYALTTQTASTITQETSTITSANTNAADKIRLASFNVENLSPVGTQFSTGETTTQAKFNNLAAALVNNLGSPDIVSLQEVQDNDGIANLINQSVNNLSETSASATLTALLAAIVAAGGPQYVAVDAPPLDDLEGGAPGGNIRVAYLYNPLTVTPVTALTDVAMNVKQYNGARIGDNNADFSATRHSVPIEWTTTENALQAGSTFWTINNHFSSKGGSGALIGTQADGPLFDEPVNGSANKREGQAIAVNTFIDGILGNANALDDRVLVMGDFNDFQFFPVSDLVAGKITRTVAGGTGNNTPSTFAADTAVLRTLMDKLPEGERYTYSFDGNAQALDHIMVSLNLYGSAQLDIVHMNSEFNSNSQLSDHDPSVTAFLSVTGKALATSGNDALNQAAYVAAYGAEFGSLAGANQINALGGDDTINGGTGQDTLTGGTGADSFVFLRSELAAGVNDTVTDYLGSDGDLLVVKGGSFDDISFSGSSLSRTLAVGTSTNTVTMTSAANVAVVWFATEGASTQANGATRIYDAAGTSDWSDYTDYFGNLGQFDYQLGRWDSGVRAGGTWSVDFDQAGNQSFEYYRNEYTSAGALYEQSGLTDDGRGWNFFYDNGLTKQQNWHDAAATREWSDYIDYFNPTGAFDYQVGFYDGSFRAGGRWSYEADETNTQYFQWYRNEYNSAGVVYQQFGYTDDGRSWEFVIAGNGALTTQTWTDVANNYAWANFTDTLGDYGNGLTIHRVGQNDNGSAINEYF